MIDGDRWVLRLSSGKAAGYDGEFHWAERSGEERKIVSYGGSEFMGFRQLNVLPITKQYAWFFGDSKEALWSDLRSLERWEEVRSRLEFIETKQIREQTCDVFRISYPALDREFEVAFSREYGGFPIQVALKLGGRLLGRSDATRLYRHASGAVIPLELRGALPDSPSETAFMIDEKDLRINEPIPDIEFAFDPTGADEVQSVDSQPSTPSPAGWSRNWVLASVAIALAGVGIFVVMKRRNRV